MNGDYHCFPAVWRHKTLKHILLINKLHSLLIVLQEFNRANLCHELQKYRQHTKGSFDRTDWSVFEAAAPDVDELTDIVTSIDSFCDSNNKPGLTANSGQGGGRQTCTFRPKAHWQRRQLKRWFSANDPQSAAGNQTIHTAEIH